MSLSLDPRKAFLVRQHGDLTAVYTWVNDERALVLIPRYRVKPPWYIVCESAAYMYDDAQYLARQAKKAAEVMGLGESVQTWMRIATIIDEGLEDLIRMPSAPEPELKKAATGVTKFSMDGQVVNEIEHHDEVLSGAEYAPG